MQHHTVPSPNKPSTVTTSTITTSIKGQQGLIIVQPLEGAGKRIGSNKGNREGHIIVHFFHCKNCSEREVTRVRWYYQFSLTIKESVSKNWSICNQMKQEMVIIYSDQWFNFIIPSCYTDTVCTVYNKLNIPQLPTVSFIIIHNSIKLYINGFMYTIDTL